MFCGNCGKNIVQNSNYCEFCGTKIDDNKPFKPNQEQHSASKANRASGLQTAALVMGILGFFIFLCGPLAIIFGSMTLKENPNKNAKWGFWLGVISTTIMIIGILAAMILVALDSARQKALDASKVNYIQQIHEKG